MLEFDKLLTRADVPLLEKLIGPPAVRLLKVLDSDLLRGNELRRILTSLRPPAELITQPDGWEELVDLLPGPVASELVEHCQLEQNGDPWDTLKKSRPGYGKKAAERVYQFFGIETPVAVEPEQLEESVKPVNPEYSLFLHQRTACNKAAKLLREEERRVVLHMPTGAGKTRTAMHLIARHLSVNEPTMAIWLAYSEELCDQAAMEFERAWQYLGNRSVKTLRFWGKHEADLTTCEDGLIVAGLSKIYSRTKADLQFLARLADSVSLVVIDEAHQALAETYALVLDVLHSKSPDTALLGLTATPGRSWDDIDADRRFADFFANKKVTLAVEGYPNPINYLIDQGYLAEPTYRQILHGAEDGLTDSERKSITDHLDIPGEFLRRLGRDEQRNLKILVEVEKLADAHSRVLLFAPSVESAKLLATVLQAHDHPIEAQVVTGKTDAYQRRRVIRWFKEPTNSPRVICNFGVLTTGFDAPRTSAVVIGRPTKSLVLYSQMLGRALRGPKVDGNPTAEVVTVVDTQLPGFRDLAEAFMNWEDAGWDNITE